MKILDELWYGNIAPFEQSVSGDKRFAELLKLVNQNRDELVRSLTVNNAPEATFARRNSRTSTAK